MVGHNITTQFVLLEYGGSPSSVENIPYQLIFDDNGDLTGKFILLISHVPIDNTLREIQTRGAAGAIVQSRQGILAAFYQFLLVDPHLLTCHALQISLQVATLIT